MNSLEAPSTLSSQTVTGLLHQLTTQLSMLLRQELRLARTEVTQSLTRLLSSVGTILTGVALLHAGLLLLLIAAVFGLALLMPVWLAALSVGVAIIVIGLMLVWGGQKLLRKKPLTPSHLPDSLRRDKDVLLGRTRL